MFKTVVVLIQDILFILGLIKDFTMHSDGTLEIKGYALEGRSNYFYYARVHKRLIEI